MPQHYVTGPARLFLAYYSAQSLLKATKPKPFTTELKAGVGAPLPAGKFPAADAAAPVGAQLVNKQPQGLIPQFPQGGRLENQQRQLTPGPFISTLGFRELGATKRSPRILIRPSFSPVFEETDFGNIPADMVFNSEEALILADLSWYNEEVMAMAQARTRPFALNGRAYLPRGVYTPLDSGTLMLAEDKTPSLIVTFPYAAKSRNSPFGAMPPAYRFFRSILLGPDELEDLTTVPRNTKLVWHCLPIKDPITGVQFLYDHIVDFARGGILSFQGDRPEPGRAQGIRGVGEAAPPPQQQRGAAPEPKR